MNNNGKRSIISAGLALPAALLVSNCVAWYFKAHNPNDVDVTNGLAYLRQILVAGFLTFAVFMIVGIISLYKGFKNDASRELSDIGLRVILIVIVLSIAAGIASNGAGRAEESYRSNQDSSVSRPS